MIVYRLQCAAGHCFDEWFASGAEYEKMAADRAVACPECGDRQVSKAIMAPHVGKSAPTATPSPCASCGEAGGCPMAGHGF